jgi:hypothetical protein
VKAGLLELVAHAVAQGGWSVRRAAATLGVDHVRVLRWQARAAADRLDDARPGPDVALHALLDHERIAIVKLAEEWAEIDRSHRKLAHRGSRLSDRARLGVNRAAGAGRRGRRAARPRPARIASGDAVAGLGRPGPRV